MILRRTRFSWQCSQILVPFLLCLLAAQTTAQQRPRPDSLARDSARADSAEVAKDSLRPPPILAKHPIGLRASAAVGVWEWSADDLLREGAVTLTDLLQRIPGATPYRGGLYVGPEVVAPFGHTRGRLEVFLDGYQLDPLTEASFDLSRIELAQMSRVRVERRLDVTRIDLVTLEATDARPQSRVEAGVGEPDVNVFRGLLVVPRFVIGPLGFAVERVDTDGYRSDEPADVFAGWFKWGWLGARGGIQAEMRQTRQRRIPDSPWPGDADRRDLMVRGRLNFSDRWVAELFAGRSTFVNDTIIEPPPDSVQVLNPEASVTQWGGRASFQSSFFWADATARVRDHKVLPSLQVDARAGVTLPRLGAAAGSLTLADWRTDGTATHYDLRAQAGPLLGLTAFGEVAGGARGAPSTYFADTIPTRFNRLYGTRLGLELQRWGISASAALFRFDTDSVQSFGLPFDTTDQRFAGARNVTGLEFTWSVPLYFRQLTLVGHYTNIRSAQVPLYQPRLNWLSGLQLHASPLPSRNLELLGRIEVRHRGDVLAPQRMQDSTWATVVLPSYNTVSAYVQIRVMDVRLFLRADNLANIAIPEFPDRVLQTPSLVYGVKWNFWN
jgi:hypothetical protein